MQSLQTLTSVRLGLKSASFLACLGGIFGLAGCSEKGEQAPLGTTEQAATGSFAISGSVTTSKGPTAGATVKLSGSETRTAFTDAAGKYTIPGLGSGGYQLSASGSTTCLSSTVNLNLTGSVTVDLGMTGTGCASLVFVPGPTGPTGPAGAKGATGATGATGAIGPTGATGAVGPAGAIGAIGPVGPAGTPGLPGAQGLPGAPGAQGLPGTPGAQGPSGPQGVKGDKGDQGDPGPQGPAGPAAGEAPDLVAVGVLTLGDIIDTSAILSFSQSVHMEGALGGGGGAGKAVFSPITVVRLQDRDSPTLSATVAKGTHIQDAELNIGPNLTIELEDVLVDSVSTDHIQNGIPTEEVGLTFKRITWSWSDGGPIIEFSWDIPANQGGGGALDAEFAFFGPGVRASSYPRDWIPFTSYSHALAMVGGSTGGGGGAGKAHFEPFTVVTAAGKGTPRHFGLVVTGRHEQETSAHFLTLDSDGSPFERFRYDLEDITGNALTLETTPSGALRETLSLDYAKIHWTATDGPDEAEVSHGWDIPANKQAD